MLGGAALGTLPLAGDAATPSTPPPLPSSPSSVSAITGPAAASVREELLLAERWAAQHRALAAEEEDVMALILALSAR